MSLERTSSCPPCPLSLLLPIWSVYFIPPQHATICFLFVTSMMPRAFMHPPCTHIFLGTPTGCSHNHNIRFHQMYASCVRFVYSHRSISETQSHTKCLVIAAYYLFKTQQLAQDMAPPRSHKRLGTRKTSGAEAKARRAVDLSIILPYNLWPVSYKDGNPYGKCLRAVRGGGVCCFGGNL